MQALYACRQSEPQDTDTFRKNFLTGIERINDLYALQASLLDAIVRKTESRLEARRAKHFASPQERTPNRKFAENPFSALLTENPAYARACQKYASLWADHSEYVENLLGTIEATPQYERYMNSADTSFAGHKAFLIFVFREIIAPDAALSDFYEDCDMDWSADLPVANTMLLKTLEDVKENHPDFSIPALFKDASDRMFAVELLEKSLSEGPGTDRPQGRKLGPRTHRPGRYDPNGNGGYGIRVLPQHSHQGYPERIHRTGQGLLLAQKPGLRKRYPGQGAGRIERRRQNSQIRPRTYVIFS